MLRTQSSRSSNGTVPSFVIESQTYVRDPQGLLHESRVLICVQDPHICHNVQAPNLCLEASTVFGATINFKGIRRRQC